MTPQPIPVGRPRDLENYRDRIHRGVLEAPKALDWLNEQRATVPDLIARTYDGNGGKSPGISDRTAATATELDRLYRYELDILDAIAVIGKAVKVFEDAVSAARSVRANVPTPTPTTTEHTETLCIGFTGGPACNELPDYRIDAAGTIVMHLRCVRCEAAQTALDARRRAETDARRLRRYANATGAQEGES